jgi:hypothetical protein
MARADSHTDNSLFPKVPDGLFIDAVFSSIGEGAIATDEFGRIVRINYSSHTAVCYKNILPYAS